MTEYTQAIALTDRLIKKKGRDILIKRANKTENSDPWKQDTEDSSDFKVKGFFLGKMKTNREEQVIQSDIETVLVAAKDLEVIPTTEDSLVDCLAEKTYTIEFVDTLKPGDENILFTIGIKT